MKSVPPSALRNQKLRLNEFDAYKSFFINSFPSSIIIWNTSEFNEINFFDQSIKDLNIDNYNISIDSRTIQSDEIYLLKSFQNNLLDNLILRGISNISKVIPRKIIDSLVPADGNYVKKETWVVDTVGTNLMDLLPLDYIDTTRTYTTDIQEIYRVMGVEAARQSILNEISEVIEFDSTYINYHHLSLLCDRMTSTQGMVSIFRSGILNDDIGPISKSTFELHTEVFLNAARHADFDHMRGVSANVMMGQHGYFGTGCFSLVLDMKEMENMDSVEVESKDKTIEDIFGKFEEKGDTCSKNKIEIKNNIAAIKSEDNGACNTNDSYDIGF